ncbi:MAG: hypothetical protein KVP17_003293 [Porospora cf. gigantea B]|uniref:uncharacterized protein n=1 Tax=Porospora cf. gigantea B TaxID=2853592 RepID=UPI003571BFDD|nr:MAG: hypothetical protein KVP17_003293 [Porospora cf. gigantea B]
MLRRWFASTSPLVPVDRFSQEFHSSFNADTFEGFRFDVAKTRGPFSLMGTLGLGALPVYPGYLWQLGPIYQSGSTVAALRLASDRALTARLSQTHKTLEGRFMAEVGFPKTGPSVAWEASVSKDAGETGTLAGSIKVAMQQSTYIYNASLAKKVAPGLHVGSDLTLIEGNNTSTMITGIRYDGCPGNVLTAFVSRQPDFETADIHKQAHSAKLQYWRRVSDRLCLGSELEAVRSSRGDLQSCCRVAYDHFFRNARVQGSISSEGEVRVLALASNGVSVSGSADLLAGKFSVGLGLTGPSDDS